MSLKDKVSVNSHYTRSVNLTRDSHSSLITGSYIPTSRALKTLDQISHSLEIDESPRAWSLIGPYGSGKSSFAVFLSHLLSKRDEDAQKVAYKILKESSPALHEKYSSVLKGGKGYCPVLLTGSPESLSKSLLSALHHSASTVWEGRRGKKPEILELLAHHNDQTNPPKVSELLGLISALQDALINVGYSGILIAIDELGKFLEYEARHYGANDIFLLQGLAELAFSKHDVKLSLVVMLHQSIEQYARGLGETLKNEWAKVQGRFESIPFLDTSEQTLRIVAKAITTEFSTSDTKAIKSKISSQVEALIENNALPATLNKNSAKDLFYRCHPLHPISALVLPVLCQKVAQNERTLFSYLGSKEPHGFIESLNQCDKAEDQILPWEIYEYFIRSQSVATSDHFTHRRWAEVVTAVERLGDASFKEVHLLKTIGLLNIIGSQGGLKASSLLLQTCCLNEKEFQESIKKLENDSIVQYRKFNSEYRVWQGSDFDLEIRAEDARDKLGAFSLADKLNERHEILPIVARKYSIENGTLRYFEPIFTGRKEYTTLQLKSRQPRVIFYLSESDDDEKFFLNEVLNHFESDDIFVLCPNGEQIREVLADVLALEQVSRTSQELTSDPVAQREYKDRYENAVEQELSLITSIINTPRQSKWYWRHEHKTINTKTELQRILSEVLSQIYSSSPVIKNELINRNKTSSQANAARNKLVAALSTSVEKEDLGIEKFPPEKSIYRSLLRATGLHYRAADDKWKLADLNALKKHTPDSSLIPVWQKIYNFLLSSKKTSKTFVEINEELYSAPFGIKEGVLPLLYIAAILAYQDKLAVTEDNVYIPYITQDHLDRFYRRPDTFQVQYVDLEGVNGRLIHEYSSVWRKGKKPDTILKIAREIAKLIDDLPFYTKQTKTDLSKEAKSVIDAFKLSKSPVKLLLEDIPKVLNINTENPEESGLNEKLRFSLLEMQGCFPKMKAQMLASMSIAFDLPKDSRLSDVRKSVTTSCSGLEEYTIDDKGQKGLITRIQRTSKHLDDEAWFDNILMFLASKPANKWSDSDRTASEYKLVTLVRQVRELEKLRASYEGVSSLSENSDVYMLNSVKAKGRSVNEIVIVDDKLKKIVDPYKEQVLDILNQDLLGKKVGTAILAEVIDDYFKDLKSENSGKQNKEDKDSNGVA